MSNAQEQSRIRELNDTFRKTFAGGTVVMSASVAALPDMVKSAALPKVAEFDAFDADNDPHHEHDFGSFELAGDKYFFKIDLYEEPDVKSANGEPLVTRVLTIMLAEEY